MASIILHFVEKTDNRNLNPPTTGRNVAAWPVADFVQTPANGKYPTTQSPSTTGTTDASGNCTLTGLTGTYYVSIVDEAGMPHWTQPLVAGSGATNTLTYVPAPFTPAAPTPTPSVNPFVALLDLKTLGDVGNFAPDWLQNVPAYVDGSGLQNWYGVVTTTPIKFSAGDNLMGAATNVDCPVFAGGSAMGALSLVIHDLVGTNFVVIKRTGMSMISGTQLQAGFDSGDRITQTGADIVVQVARNNSITTTAGGVYVVSFGMEFTGGSLT